MAHTLLKIDQKNYNNSTLRRRLAQKHSEYSDGKACRITVRPAQFIHLGLSVDTGAACFGLGIFERQ
jgi:hypothetical protein